MGVPWRVRLVLFLGALFAMVAAESSARLLPYQWAGITAAHVVWAGITALIGTALLDLRLRRDTSRWRALHSLSRRLSQPLELHAILEAGIAHAAEFSGADAACLRLLNDQGDMVVANCLNVPAGFESEYRAVRPGEQIASAVMVGSEPVVLSSVALAPDLRAMLPKGKAGAAVITPLVCEGKALGLIALVFGTPRMFAADDIEALRAMGAQIAGAAANARTRSELIRQAQTDALTGVSSRRYFEDAVRRELFRARRVHSPLSLAMVDIDRFKQINDTHGHLMGDHVLRAVAEAIRSVRGTDVVARLGGDEFVILMPDTSLEEAEAVVDRVRERMDQLNGQHRFPFSISLSIGVRQMTDLSLENLLASADEAMYSDKRSKALQTD